MIKALAVIIFFLTKVTASETDLYLTIDIGNTFSKSSLFMGDEIIQQHKKATKHLATEPEISSFLTSALTPYEMTKGVAISSVVKDVTPLWEKACRNLNFATYTLKGESETGLTFAFDNPSSLGSDRIAACLGARQQYPDNVIIIDAGTANTITVMDYQGKILGGQILIGCDITSKTLHNATSLLPYCPGIKNVDNPIATTTEENIIVGNSSLFKHRLKGIIEDIKASLKNQNKTIVITSGGYGKMLHDMGIGELDIPDLKFTGLYNFLRSKTEKTSQ